MQLSTDSPPITKPPASTTLTPYNFTASPSRSPNRHHLLARASLILVDSVLVFSCATYVYGATQGRQGLWHLIAGALLTGIWITLMQAYGLYNTKISRPAHQLAYDLAKVATLSLLAGATLFYVAPQLDITRESHGLAILAAGFVLASWRLLYLKVFQLPNIKKRALFIGPRASAEDISTEIDKNPNSGYQIVGYLDEQFLGAEALDAEGIPGSNLEEIISGQQIDTIILPAEQVSDGTLKALADCSDLDYELINTVRLYERISGRVPIRQITHGWFVTELAGSNRPAYRLGKRFMDIILASVGLFATGLLFPLIALLIKLDSPGPIFYSQTRSGKNGRPFTIYKFRSMVTNAEAHGAVWAQVNDTRVTRLGEFLRKTRLDELPQLYNVLLGDMSMVGPRPERPEFIEKLAREIPYFHKRQLILPGLTGWAQVNYPYGASTADAIEKLQYDLYYIKNRSMFLDIAIILKTVGVVLKKQGAR